MSLLVEIRTAYFVAQLGTVSAAATALGVHRATVIRRIDLLEAELGMKVFLRHCRGYSLTELGQSLVRSAEAIESEAERFIGLSRIKTDELSGDFIIATPPGSAPTVVASVIAFRRQFPNVKVHHKVVSAPPKMELGEAHVYFHFGEKLEQPDYVLCPWMTFFGGIYGHETYLDAFGNPESLADIPNHRFALLDEAIYSPPNDWIRANVPSNTVIFTSNERHTIWRAVQDGLALGCIGDHLAHINPRIHKINIAVPNIKTVCWMVTHVDTHRSPKVQAYLNCMRSAGLMGKHDTDMDPELMPSV